MRTMLKAAAAVLALLIAGPALGQEQAEPAPVAAPAAAGLPDAPVPYTTIRPQRTAVPRSRPSVARSPAPAAAGPVIAGAAPMLPALPISAAGARLPGGAPLPLGEVEAFVDAMVTEAMGRDHVAGVTIAIVQNGQVVLKKGYGFSNLNPQKAVDPDRTLFRVGSISKTLTWIALMREVEAGRIRLNQPINLYLPEKVRVRDQGFSDDVRVANLMDHSAGFEDRALGQLFERDFERVRPLDLYLRQERPRRVRGPGIISSYSNYGSALAGQAVAYVSGRPFERLIEEDILLPLGMTQTTFRELRPEKRGLPGAMPQRLTPDVAKGYRWTPGGFKVREDEFIGQVAPAGAASSTAGDMSRYMLMLLGDGVWNGAAVFGPQTAQAFRKPLRRTPDGVNGWAHGFMVYSLPGGYRGFGHGGATIAFHSNMVLVPHLNLGVFISTNSDNGYRLASRLPDRLMAQFYAPPQTFPRPGSPELARRKSAFEGYYLTTRRTYGGLEGFVGLLTGGAAVSTTPEGRLVTGGGEGAKIWVPEGPLNEGRFIAAQGDERMAFRMADGRAVAYDGSGGAQLMERAPFWKQPALLLLLGVLTAAASLATLGGLFFRNRREFRENQVQSRAALIQNIQAGLWLASMALFGLWASKTGDIAQVMYRWPGALVILASACALVAAALTLTTLVALPAVWRGGRRVDSWSLLRKAFFSVTVVIYAAVSAALALWGALAPWSG